MKKLKRHSFVHLTKGQRSAQKLANLCSFSHFDWKSIKSAPKKTVSKLFWTVVYVSGSILTLLTCKDLYNQWLQQPLSSITVAGMRNKTITLPDVTICLPITTYDSENLIYTLEKESYSYGMQFYTDALNSLFKNKSTWQEFQKFQWPASVVLLSQNFMSIIYEVETMSGYEENPISYSQNATDSASQIIWRVLVPKLIEWKVTIGQFKIVFGQKFLEFYPINVALVTKALSGNQTKQLRNLELVSVSQVEVCYKLKFVDIQLESSDSVEIKISDINLADGEKFFLQRFPFGVSEAFYYAFCGNYAELG